MFLIGLTGGICSGKTYVLTIFEQLGCFTYRADEFAKQLIFKPESELLEEIISIVGKEALDDQGRLHKERFSRILFSEDEKRHKINELVHPVVIRERNQKIEDIQKTGLYDLFIYESALLVEARTYKDFDRIVVVYTSPEEQVSRLMKRDGIDRDGAEKKIQAQFPLKEKLRVASYTIDSSGTFEETRLITMEVFHLLRQDLLGENA